MSRLNRGLRSTVKEGTLFDAILVDHGGGRGSARLSNNGAIYTNLAMVGDDSDIENGDPCWVDFSTSTPFIILEKYQETVYVPPKKALPSRAGLGATAISGSPTSGSTGTGDYGIILYGSGVVKSSYTASGSGFDQATAAAIAGDVIFLPVCAIDGAHTLPIGVMLMGLSRYGSVITGPMTFAGNNYIETLSVSGSGTSGSGPTSHMVNINGDCTFRSVNISQRALKEAIWMTGGYSLFRECHIEAIGTCVGGTSGSGHFFTTDFACDTDIDATNLYVTAYGVSFNKVIGTIHYLEGDRSTYEISGHHASDIDDETYVYHAPHPTSGSGQTLVSSGSGWNAEYLSQPDYSNHAANHGSGAADELVHVASGSPSKVFPGKLWLQT